MRKTICGVMFLAVAVGCGSSGGGGGDGFTIQQDIRNDPRVYQRNSAFIGASYEPNTDTVVLVVDAVGVAGSLSVFGPPTGPRSFVIEESLFDDDDDGSFQDEPFLPASGSGTFSRDGRELSVVIRVGGSSIDFTGTIANGRLDLEDRAHDAARELLVD